VDVTTVLLAPHADDETLFAAYLAMRHQPDIVVCTRPDEERLDELNAAHEILGGGALATWTFEDDVLRTDYRGIAERIEELASSYDTVIAPAWENGGHEHHNHVGWNAFLAFGEARTVRYLTYRRGYGRSTTHAAHGDHYPDGVVAEVIPEPGWVSRKLAAMACYRSQADNPMMRPWFVDGIREYQVVAA